MVRAEKEGTLINLEVWGHHGVQRELQVPAGLHGAVLNDGWFSSGVAWDLTEERIAYVAEVRGPLAPVHPFGLCQPFLRFPTRPSHSQPGLSPPEETMLTFYDDRTLLVCSVSCH